jgi:phosphatidylinositol alpha-mannosyltransferase
VRILLVCPYAWEAPGGVQVHVRELAEQLRTRGHEVLVLAPGERRAPEPWVRIVGRPVRVPYRGTVAPISFSWRSWRRVGDAMRRFDPDVVHVHEPLTPSTSMLAVRAATAPVVATFHAYLDRSRLMEVASPVLRTVSRRIDAAIAVSDAAAEFLRRAIDVELEIIPNGLDVERFAHSDAVPDGLPEGRRLLWVSRLDPQKGFGVLVQVFALLAREHGDLSLVVAGDGRERHAIGALSATNRARVIMLGAVRHVDLPSWFYGAADVFVAPATGQESFGYILVEAMAAGVPVVASDIAGYREVVRSGIEGLLVPPGDPKALAEAVSRVLSDPILAARLSEAGRTRAAGFGWDRVVPRIEAVYRRVLDTR